MKTLLSNRSKIFFIFIFFLLSGKAQIIPDQSFQSDSSDPSLSLAASPTKKTIEPQKRFNDPQAPRFLLNDSKGNFYLGIGGRVRSTLNYDFKGVVNSVDFYPSLITAPGEDNYTQNQFQLDTSASNLFVKLIGKTSTLGDFTIYINGYFRGSGTTLKIHNAYASFMGITVGWDYGLFTDAAGSPPTIDYEGPAGQVLYRNNQVRYEKDFFDHWRFGIGIEIPAVDAQTNENVAVNTQRMPNFPLAIQYGWNKTSHFRIAGILRTMTYSSNTDKKAHSKTGWGVQGSTLFTITPGWIAYAQGTYGEGIGHFFNDLSTLDIDLVPDPKKQGQMQLLSMLGWYAGMKYNFTPALFISGTYSQSRIYNKNNYSLIATDNYRYGQYLAANLFWNITSDLQVAAEYLRGWKNNFDRTTNHANRISLLMQYSF